MPRPDIYIDIDIDTYIHIHDSKKYIHEYIVLTHSHYYYIFPLYYCSVEPSATTVSKEKDESERKDVNIEKSNEITLANEEVSYDQKL